MKYLKFCPDLTTKSWQPAMLRGSGDYQTLEPHKCLKIKCAAYKDGKCQKYGTEVEVEVKA